MAKPETIKTRLICEGCGATTDYMTHDAGANMGKVKAALLKKVGWKDDCPECERDKRAKRKSL